MNLILLSLISIFFLIKMIGNRERATGVSFLNGDGMISLIFFFFYFLNSAAGFVPFPAAAFPPFSLQGPDVPHELVQDVLHPHVHSQGVEAVVPEELEKVDDVPAALLEDELLSVINAYEAAVCWGNREALRKGVKNQKGNLMKGRACVKPNYITPQF